MCPCEAYTSESGCQQGDQLITMRCRAGWCNATRAGHATIRMCSSPQIDNVLARTTHSARRGRSDSKMRPKAPSPRSPRLSLDPRAVYGYGRGPANARRRSWGSIACSRARTRATSASTQVGCTTRVATVAATAASHSVRAEGSCRPAPRCRVRGCGPSSIRASVPVSDKSASDVGRAERAYVCTARLQCHQIARCFRSVCSGISSPIDLSQCVRQPRGPILGPALIWEARGCWLLVCVPCARRACKSPS